MKRRCRVFFVLGLLLLLVAGLGCGASGPPPSMLSPVLGKRLPAFEGTALDGTTIRSSDAGGRVVVVDFFAKYCEPCMRSLPGAQRLHRRLPDVWFIGVNEDEDLADAQYMVDTFGLTFPVIHDPENEIATAFRVTEMPVVFVVDRRSIIEWVGGDGHSKSDLRRAIAGAGATADGSR